MSTATPVPLHTPHASRAPPTQHAPTASVEASPGQHRPSTAEMALWQHVPAASTTPSTHGPVAAVVRTSTVAQPGPVHPGAHAHVPPSVHTARGPPTQSREVVQVQVDVPAALPPPPPRTAHDSVVVGLGPEQAPSPTGT
jgi:hypothetical protein